MKQFDHQIHNTFKENLDNIHASEDLIAATLKSMKLENSTPSEGDKKAGTLSAIDTRFIRNHVKEIEKTAKRNKLRKTALISFGSVAASLVLIAGSIFVMLNISEKNKKATPCLSPSISFIASYESSLSRNNSAMPVYSYSFYAPYINNATPNLLHDNEGNAYKDYDVPEMEKLEGTNRFWNISSEEGSTYAEILDEADSNSEEEVIIETVEVNEENS